MPVKDKLENKIPTVLALARKVGVTAAAKKFRVHPTAIRYHMRRAKRAGNDTKRRVVRRKKR